MSRKNSFIFEGARVIDPVRKIDEVRDLGVRDGRFVSPETVGDAVRVSLKGKVAAPGFIDIHTHLRQPGDTHKETIRHGSMAAAAGGFATIAAMPNTNPCADNVAAIEYIRRHAGAEAVVRVLPTATITKGREGKEMSGIGTLKKAGVVAITDDGNCVQNNELFRHVMEYAGSFQLPILDHCEDENLFAGGLVHEGYWSAITGLRGIPSAAEEVIVARNIILVRKIRHKIHLQHLSAAGSVRMLREARREGLPITAEATPHHIALSDASVRGFDTNFKMNPPLRSEEDRLALLEGLKDDTITVIATDHAPHSETEKLVEFALAPFGVVGLETAVPVCLTELFHKGVLTLPQLIAKFTAGPAEVLNLEYGTLRDGAPADLTVLDLDREFQVDAATFRSKSRNTPFHGYQARGKAVATIVEGRVVFSELPDVPGVI